MKVVLFCGGLGMRLRDYSDQIPKPLVEVGDRPILWHLMRYYAHYGHKEFILCLGHGSQKIKDYFLQYDECSTNDFVLSEGGSKVELLNTDIHDWTITFVDTGTGSLIGERLRQVERFLGDDEYFLANYADGLSDLPLDEYVDGFRRPGQDRLLPECSGTTHVSHRARRRGESRHAHGTRQPVTGQDQRRVLRASALDLRRDRTRRRTRARTV